MAEAEVVEAAAADALRLLVCDSCEANLLYAADLLGDWPSWEAALGRAVSARPALRTRAFILNNTDDKKSPRGITPARGQRGEGERVERGVVGAGRA